MYGSAMLQDHGPSPVPQVSQSNRIASFLDEPADPDDTDDWEYEYSTTDYETFYVTLDLTNPAAPPKRLTKGPLGRGAPLTQWTNLAAKRAAHVENHPTTHRTVKRMKLAAAQEADNGSDFEDAEDDAGLEDGAVQEQQTQAHDDTTDVMPSIEPADEKLRKPSNHTAGLQGKDVPKGTSETSAGKNEQSTKRPRENDIQILDLHTRNPLVSYGGNIFSCQWAENHGTEFLFMDEASSKDLATMRTLPDRVNLLGAITARLVSLPAQLNKRDLSPSDSPEPLNKTQLRSNDPSLRIPIGMTSTARRKGQARFLEKLIDLKEDLGETDRVTVFAQKRLMNSQWRSKVKSLRQTERARLNRVISFHSGGGPEVDEAREKLRFMDEEDANRPAVKPLNGKPGRKRKVPACQAKTGIVRRPIRAANIMQRKFGMKPAEDDDQGSTASKVKFADGVDAATEAADAEDDEDEDDGADDDD